MQLITDEIITRSMQLGTQDGRGDSAIVIAKFFTPSAGATWFITDVASEGLIEEGLAFGFAYLGPHLAEYAELGYVSIDELQMGTGMTAVERDINWIEETLGEAKQRLAMLSSRIEF